MIIQELCPKSASRYFPSSFPHLALVIRTSSFHRVSPFILTPATGGILAFIRRTEFPFFVHGRNAARVEPPSAALELCVRKWTNLGLAPEFLQQPLCDCHREFRAWGQLLRSLLPLTSGSPSGIVYCGACLETSLQHLRATLCRVQ